jgi:hypothetical protein
MNSIERMPWAGESVTCLLCNEVIGTWPNPGLRGHLEDKHPDDPSLVLMTKLREQNEVSPEA